MNILISGRRRLHAARDGLRGRVALMCLLTAAPLILLLVSGALIDRSEALRAAKMRAEELARLGAEQQTKMASEAMNTLQLLSELPAVRSIAPMTCNKFLKITADADPWIDRISVLRPDGTVGCSSGRSSWTDLAPNDRASVKTTLSAKPVVSSMAEVVVSSITGKSTIVTALPLPLASAMERPEGVIIAALSLEWLSQLVARIPPHIGYIALVIDRASGDVVGRNPVLTADQGETGDIPALLRTSADSPTGDVVTASFGGYGPLLFGLAPVTVGKKHFLVAVGLSRDDVLKAANHRLHLGAMLALVAVVTALLLASVAASILVLRPIDALSDVANRLGAGDLDARAPTRSGVSELRALGLAFNRMAARLQVRNRQRARLQSELTISEENHRLLAENATDMITRLTREFRFSYVSPSSRDLLAYDPEELIGKTQQTIVHPDDWIILNAALNAPLGIGQGQAPATYRAIRKDGAWIWLESNGRRLADGTGFVVVTRDISERKAFEDQLEEANHQLEELATLDPLTGLSNRRHFDELLQTEYRRARRMQLPISLAMIDADRFKAYNDTYGHPAGDLCLRAIAEAISGVLRRPGDLVARIGGEEFTVLFPDTDRAGAAVMMERIRQAVHGLAIPHRGSDLGFVTISVGVATTVPYENSNPATLIEIADKMLYAAKIEGRNIVRTIEI